MWDYSGSSHATARPLPGRSSCKTGARMRPGKSCFPGSIVFVADSLQSRRTSTATGVPDSRGRPPLRSDRHRFPVFVGLAADRLALSVVTGYQALFQAPSPPSVNPVAPRGSPWEPSRQSGYGRLSASELRGTVALTMQRL